jgi:hypothetical protein
MRQQRSEQQVQEPGEKAAFGQAMLSGDMHQDLRLGRNMRSQWRR